MLGILLVIALFGTSILPDEFLGGSDLDLSGAAATQQLDYYLAAPLPDGVEIVGLYEGGFQDRYVQIRLSLPRTELGATLDALGISSPAFAASNNTIGIASPDWWRPGDLTSSVRAEVRFQHYTFASIYLGDDPYRAGMIQMYIVAIES